MDLSGRSCYDSKRLANEWRTLDGVEIWRALALYQPCVQVRVAYGICADVDGGDRLSIPSDIEMSFLRTLSVNGFIFSGDLSPQDRRERIRVAIIQQRLAIERFSDQFTYAQAFRECYARALDMRRVPRDSRQRPTDFPIPDDEDDCGDKDEEGFF